MLQPSSVKRPPKSAIIGLGANLPSAIGSPLETLQAALKRLEDESIDIQSVSRFYSTPCFPAGAGPDYVNAAVRLITQLLPDDLLSRLHVIEESLGRERKERWGQRVIDIDLLAFDDSIMPDIATYRKWLEMPLDSQIRKAPEQLILPHPRLQDRAFVLVPMADVAPDWEHPYLRRTTLQMLAELKPDDIATICPL